MPRVVIFLIFALATTVFAGEFFPRLQDGQRARVSYLENNQRSPKGVPKLYEEEIDIKITFGDGQEVDLHLMLLDRRLPHCEVELVSKNGKARFDTTHAKNYRFYQSVESGASVMVRCRRGRHAGKTCVIVGNFFYNGVEYVIDRSTNVANVVSSDSQTVQKVNKKHECDNTHDTVKETLKSEDKKSLDNEKERVDEFEEDLEYLIARLLGYKRTKRQTTVTNYTIELQMIVAYDIYQFWYLRTGNDSTAAIDKITEYYQQVAHNMDVRFSSVSSSSNMNVDIVPRVISIMQDAASNPWITNNTKTHSDGTKFYQGGQVLDAFHTWALSNRHMDCDAAISFSSINMWDGTTQDTSGLTGIAKQWSYENGTTLSAMCMDGTDNIISVSLVEDLIDGDTSSTAAHELAHTMGVSHDLNQTQSCLEEHEYLMAPKSAPGVKSANLAQNPWKFSPCSITQMKQAMDGVTKDGNGLTCLQKHTFNTTEYNAILNGTLLGQLYNRDEQCGLLKKGSKYADSTNDTTLNDICWKGMPCNVTEQSYNSYKPMSGTSCGNGKICYLGLCVNSGTTTASAASTTTTATTTTSTSTTTTTPTTTTTTSTSTTTTTPTTTTTTTTTTPSPAETTTGFYG